MRVTFVILCCMLVTRVYSMYNCKRLEDCQNGGTCNDDGTCTCVNGTHYRCEVDNTVPCAAETIDCGANGQCFTDVTDVCACDYGYYGTNCESSLVEIDCTADSATYILMFPDSFTGTVEIVPANPATTVTETCVKSPTTADGYKTYNASFDLSTEGTTDCPTSLLSPADQGGENMDYSALLIVRYWPNLSTSLDELYNLTCSHVGGVVEIYQDISNVSLTVTDLDQVTKDKSFSPIEMALTKDSGTMFDSETSLIVGDKFDVNVFLNVDTGSFASVRFESCVANNTLEGGESRRKRRAAGDDNEERTVSAVITVLNPGETLKDASTVRSSP
ncbi:ELDP1-like protein [Mya arenaria]|uniref:ELDP1-like protein n=1 Tax=Mya arenaria TaxID=6604 RepID=A0ABY7E869_MYAAR|nr:ELDP1-like protein [Mya arenaria]